jgi:hypothetical protein
VAGQMRGLLLGAAFGGQPIPVGEANQLILEGYELLAKAALLGG